MVPLHRQPILENISLYCPFNTRNHIAKPSMNKKITETGVMFWLHTSRTEDSVPKCQNPTTISVPRIHISRYNDYIVLNNGRDSLHCRGIILYHYLEYHSVCPLVRIGSFHLLSRRRVWPPPSEPRGGRQHSPAGEGLCGSNWNDWRESLALCLRCAWHR